MNDCIFLSLGTNTGDRLANLEKARAAIKMFGNIISLSSTYQTEAWGKTDQPAFYNQVIEISTALSPVALLSAFLAIEIELGRVREEKWGPRTIDIDILFYGSTLVNQENLILPHPGIADRKFVLVPLNEIASEFIHPVYKKNISELLRACPDSLAVEKINPNLD